MEDPKIPATSAPIVAATAVAATETLPTAALPATPAPHLEKAPTDADGPGRALIADAKAGVAAVASVEAGVAQAETEVIGLEEHEKTLWQRLKNGASVSALAIDLKIGVHDVVVSAEALAKKVGGEIEAFGVGVERKLFLRSAEKANPPS